MGSSQTRDRTSALFIARQILNHWTTREALYHIFLTVYLSLDTWVAYALWLLWVMLLWHLCKNISLRSCFHHLFIFNLFLSLDLNWFSCRWLIIRTYHFWPILPISVFWLSVLPLNELVIKKDLLLLFCYFFLYALQLFYFSFSIVLFFVCVRV